MNSLSVEVLKTQLYNVLSSLLHANPPLSRSLTRSALEVHSSLSYSVIVWTLKVRNEFKRYGRELCLQNCSWKPRQKVAKKQPGSAAQGSLLCGVVLIFISFALQQLISSFLSCRFNDNQISLNSVFFLAQSLATLEHIKTVSLRYDLEYFCIILLFKTSGGFWGAIQELVLSNSMLMMFFSGYSLGHTQVVHLTFWERVR